VVNTTPKWLLTRKKRNGTHFKEGSLDLGAGLNVTGNSHPLWHSNSRPFIPK